ncbi:MAG: hypothetical protein IIT85_02635, partial [Prevotella sp.]|nr:hypothetical protein [Prevotella sp.]
YDIILDWAKEAADEIETNPINSTRLQYTTEGLENKREIALTVPTIESWNTQDEVHFGDAGQGRAVAWVRFGETTIDVDNTKQKEAYNEVSRKFNEYADKMRDKYGSLQTFLYGMPNERGTEEEINEYNKRYDAISKAQDETLKSAKQRVLVIDEIQSKRHQEGREKGYKPQVSAEQKEAYEKAREASRKATGEMRRYRKALSEKYGTPADYFRDDDDVLEPYATATKRWLDSFTEEERAKYERLESQEKELTDVVQKLEEEIYADDRIPSAPFEKNWHELAMKRMLRYAAENGFDKVAWTTGEQQAERYDIGDKIKDISISVASDPMTGEPLEGKYDVFPHNHNNHTIMVDGASGLMDREQVLRVYGKDLGQRMIDAADKAGVDGDVLSGDDLRIGGEGMKGFYDEILPRFMNKYGKKWGAKVGTVELPNVEESARTMWAVDVTPEMKDSVMQGQPMFRQTQQATAQRTTMQAIREAINDIIDKLHIADRVTILESTEGLKGKKARAKGWFDVKTGKIVVVLPNNRNAADAMRTILHEGVAHFGLRELFGNNFDEFLQDVYSHSSESVRNKIDANAKKRGWSKAEATEEYLASLAETQNFEQAKKQGIWNKVKEWFNAMLNKVGIPKLFTTSYDDNELRYILWRSWRNLTEGGNRDYLGMAEDIVKREDLGVGEFARTNDEPISLFGRDWYGEYVTLNDYYEGTEARFEPLVTSTSGNVDAEWDRLKAEHPDWELHESPKSTSEYLIDRKSGDIYRKSDHWGKVATCSWKLNHVNQGAYAIGKANIRDFKRRGEHLKWYNYANERNQKREFTRENNGETRFSLREEEPPTNTGIGYKVFVLKNGKLYPPMVANPNGEATPVGVWLNADAAPVVGETKTGRKQVKAGGKGTQGGSGKLAYRPGWHLGEIPYALQFNRVNPESGQRELFPSNFVWAEVEYADDIDYNDEARSYGMNANGNYQHSLAGLPRIPENGSYKYRTNPDTRTDDWIITGAMKVNRILKPSEVDKMVMDAGREPQPRQEGAVTDEQVEALNKSLGLSESDNDIRFREDEENEINFNSETTDIWNDRRLSMTERITAAATRLAANQQDNKTLRNDAVRAIGNNLAELNKAMSLQRKFDIATAKRIADLARVLMDGGYLKDIRQQEVKRLLAAVKNSVGHNDIENDVQKIMDILVDNQLRNAEATLHELETIKGSKVNASGVEVIGQLDPDGAHIMKAFKKYRDFSKEDIEDAIANAEERMTSSDNAVADEAALDYVALQFAQEYAQNIKDSKTDEKLLRDEIKQTHDDASERERLTDAYRETIKSLQDAIRQTKIERVQAYNELVARLTNSLRGSIENAKAFKEAEQRRIAEIHHNANSDMEGRPSNEHYKPRAIDKAVNNPLLQVFVQPLMTFEQIMRVFGSKSANGEGYLFNRYVRGFIDARQKEIKGVRTKYAILDAKVKELFGNEAKGFGDLIRYKVKEILGSEVTDWGSLIRYVGKLPKAEVTFWDGDEMRAHELTQGNLMYIYMVNKMLDGKMKLRKMGISEEAVAEIEEMLDPRLKSLADWIQEDFLVKTRNEYNKTHKRMFGASMAAIENYFPLKVLENARNEKAEDLDKPDLSDTISTTTGSIIKRRRNVIALDVTKADALNVILDHVAEMEHWNAFAELKRDLNTLRTYKRFKNKVYNMNTIYGSGKQLWKKFNDTCRMMVGAYRPPRATLDETAVNIAKGVTAAKVSFRVFTALKQFLSFPAYLPEARFDLLMKNLINPVHAWNWGMENLPIFNERWKSRIAGDPRLMKTDMDWKAWRNRAVQIASRIGMSPNAFVDALTVSIGAHAIYETKKKRYLKEGYSDEQAERKAIQDAEIAYNLTQQSSESAFLSTMQVDRTWFSVMFTIFRNAGMSYQRQLHNALRNFKHNLNPFNYRERIEFMKKQYVRDGIDEAKAEENAKSKFNRQMLKDAVAVATFGYLVQFLWNLGTHALYLLIGGDDDDKEKTIDEVVKHTTFGSLEGLTGGDLMSQFGGMLLGNEGKVDYLKKEMPAVTELFNVLNEAWKGDTAEAINDVIGLAIQAGIGVNPQSITDGVLGIMDVCGDDPALAHEAMICVWRILQVPQSQIDKLYFDEVGLSGEKVSNYTPQQLAQRYAQFKVRRGRLLAPWAWNDREKERKLIDKANKTIKERVQHGNDGEISEAFERAKEIYDEVKPTMSKANKAMQKSYIDSARVISSVPDEKVVIYNLYKKADENLDKLAKGYLNSNTHAQAELYRKAILDYRAAMADAMNAPDKVKRERAIKNITAVMDDFKKKKKELNAEY